MASDSHESNQSKITPDQAIILEGFVSHFEDDSNRTITHVGYYDLVSANLRESFAKFGLPLETPEEYYPVMAGLSLATVWVKGLEGQGLTLGQAVEVIQDGLQGLRQRDV